MLFTLIIIFATKENRGQQGIFFLGGGGDEKGVAQEQWRPQKHHSKNQTLFRQNNFLQKTFFCGRGDPKRMCTDKTPSTQHFKQNNYKTIIYKKQHF